MKLGLRPQDQDTICALASPPGEGAIALVRISGRKAFSIGRKICPFLPPHPQSHKLYYGTVLNFQTKEQIDEVLVSYFQEGRSYTGEESLEISCHGGHFLSSNVLECLVLGGARLAEPGEFSYRAFMNGRIDLIQAESILDLIRSKSPSAHQQALRGLKGVLSGRLKSLEEKLLELLAHLEASIDFSEQDIEVLSVEQQKKSLQDMEEQTQLWLKSFEQSRINKEGFSVIFLGAPNAGKSSLFNCLLEEDQAIVSSYSGTTRDIISSRLIFNRREFCIKDTAGLRLDPDPIEKQGIEKVLEEIKHSDLKVYLIECTLPVTSSQFFKFKEICGNQKHLCVFSKSDQLTAKEKRKMFLEQVKTVLNSQVRLEESVIWLSSRTGEGVRELKDQIFKYSQQVSGSIFLSSPRQFEGVQKVQVSLKKAQKLLNEEASPDLIAFELREALNLLYKLLGKEYNDQVIQTVFKEFCIGK